MRLIGRKRRLSKGHPRVQRFGCQLGLMAPSLHCGKAPDMDRRPTGFRGCIAAIPATRSNRCDRQRGNVHEQALQLAAPTGQLTTLLMPFLWTRPQLAIAAISVGSALGGHAAAQAVTFTPERRRTYLHLCKRPIKADGTAGTNHHLSLVEPDCAIHTQPPLAAVLSLRS